MRFAKRRTSMASLAVVPTRKLTLFNLEESLNALVNSTETVTAEQELEFLTDLRQALSEAKDKRDCVAAFMVQCEGQAAIAQKEIDRLKRRKEFFENAVERMEGYVLKCIMLKDPDRNGRYPKLQGNTFTLSAKRNPPSLVVSDEAMVPSETKVVTVSMPAPTYDALLESIDMELLAEIQTQARVSCSVSKEKVKDAIAAEVPDWQSRLKEVPAVFAESVPGAAITAGGWRLVRE
jgi:Siphovirus Gp157